MGRGLRLEGSGGRVYVGGMKITVDVPDEIAKLLEEKGDPARKLLEDAVAQLYRERKLTQWQLRKALGIETRFEVDPFLQPYEVSDFTMEELERDIATSERLKAARAAA